MILNNIKTRQKDSGFTIVELLVVIVVIGILAAITIIAYAGITARANLSSAQQAASNMVSKVNAYNAEGVATSPWPLELAVLTSAASTASYYVPSSNLAYSALSSQPTATNNVLYKICGVKSSGAASAITDLRAGSTGSYTVVAGSTISGVSVNWWDYTTGAVSATSYSAGITSGTVNTYAVTCYATGS
jgi:prepilin-type N-terminal cleavage/methylation domain-containing protein